MFRVLLSLETRTFELSCSLRTRALRFILSITQVLPARTPFRQRRQAHHCDSTSIIDLLREHEGRIPGLLPLCPPLRSKQSLAETT